LMRYFPKTRTNVAGAMNSAKPTSINQLLERTIAFICKLSLVVNFCSIKLLYCKELYQNRLRIDDLPLYCTEKHERK
jgi:hypothetical protein